MVCLCRQAYSKPAYVAPQLSSCVLLICQYVVWRIGAFKLIPIPGRASGSCDGKYLDLLYDVSLPAWHGTRGDLYGARCPYE